MSSVSVIIVNHNGAGVVVEALDSIAKQTRAPEEVIVVDNASTDGSVAAIRARFPNVHVVEMKTNAGFAEGNNIGVVHSSGDYLALLNSDAVAHPAWLASLAAALDAGEAIGAAVPKIRRHSDPSRIEQAGAAFNSLGHCWTLGFNERDDGRFDAAREVAALTGCSAMIRRSALGDEPMFDAQFFMYYEELDLSIRMREQGYRIVYVPSAVVDHRGMVSIEKLGGDKNLRQQFYGNRNRLKIVFKYFPAPLVVRNLPLLIASAAYWDLRFLFAGRAGMFARSVVDQLRFVWRGLRERRLRTRGRGDWTQWIERQSVREMLATHVNRQG